MSGALLQTKSASFGYSGRTVVQDVTLEVQAGEFVDKFLNDLSLYAETAAGREAEDDITLVAIHFK